MENELENQEQNQLNPWDLASFFREKVGVAESKKMVLSQRFLDEQGKPVIFEIRGISQVEHEVIRAAARRPSREGGGYWLDIDLYNAKLLVAATVYPNFRDWELQRNWGVVGGEALAKSMLLAGEYQVLLREIKAICGFDINVKAVAAEVKN